MAVINTNSTADIKICSINICGVSERSRIPLDKYVYDEQYDLVALQETGSVNMNKISLTNMSTITDSNEARNKGVALYAQNKHSITKLEQISKNFKNIDSCWSLTVMNNERFIVGNVYIKLGDVNGISNIIDMLHKAQDMNSKLKSKGVILIGDLNARHPMWGDSTSNEYGKKLFEKLDHSQFTIRAADLPSFLCTNGSSYIDLVIVSNNILNKINSVTTDPVVELFTGAPLRGHVPVIVSIRNRAIQTQPPEERMCIKNINWTEWSQHIESVVEDNSQYLYSIDDPKVLLQFIDNALNGATEKYGTKKVISCHSKPYWSKKLSELSKNLRSNRKNYSKRNTDMNRDKLIQSKLEFDEERKTACQEFIMKKAHNLNAAESQKFWKEFKKIATSNINQSVNPLDDGDGGLVTEKEEKEQLMFSTFFEGRHMEGASFDEHFYNKINNEYEDIIHREGNTENEETEELNADISVTELRDSITNYKSSGKSFDNHGNHPEMLKNLGPLCLNLILILFNLCLHMKLWIWQNAEVIFLRKEGKKSYSLPGSYRPISITAYLGKLLEKILSIRAIKFLKKKNYFDPFQEGFTEKKNTIRYLNRLILGIKSDIQQGKTVICLFLDFEKAFDSVWKKGLIVKLFKLGFRGKFLKLIDHFLASRKVCLNINGNKGKLRNCSEFGVPQGSVLSPILFKIFMFDFLEDINDDNTVMYKFADDGSVKISADTTEDCLIQLQKVLDALNTWANKWRMIINCLPNKTEVMCFGTAEKDRSLIPSQFKLGDQYIKLVKSTKVLGITLDEDLTFLEHSIDVYKKLITRWNLIKIYCNRNWGFTQKVMVELTRTLFLSCLFYGSHLWMNQKNMKDINSLYYKILKSTVGAVFNVRQSITEIILGLPPVTIQNKVNQIKHYLKIIINEVPEDPLLKTIQNLTAFNSIPTDMHSMFRSVYKFLRWKLQLRPEQFSQEDQTIIQQSDFTKFHLLSPSCGLYTKNLINRYTELLWAASIENEFLNDGQSVIPKPSYTPLVIKPSADRKTEVMLMSMFYDNNLLNSFLYRHSIRDITSPLCHCGSEDQTAAHVVLRCELVDQDLRSRAKNCLASAGDNEGSSIGLLNLSRDEEFMDILYKIIYKQSDFLRCAIELN